MPDAVDVAALGRVVDYLKAHAVGKRNAKQARTIQDALITGANPADMLDARYLRLLVNHGLDAGVLICSTQRGYYLPANRAEADETIEWLKAEAAHRTQRAIRTAQLADELFSTDRLFTDSERGRE